MYAPPACFVGSSALEYFYLFFRPVTSNAAEQYTTSNDWTTQRNLGLQAVDASILGCTKRSFEVFSFAVHKRQYRECRTSNSVTAHGNLMVKD